jgi:hypothetical protein
MRETPARLAVKCRPGMSEIRSMSNYTGDFSCKHVFTSRLPGASTRVCGRRKIVDTS